MFDKILARPCETFTDASKISVLLQRRVQKLYDKTDNLRSRALLRDTPQSWGEYRNAQRILEVASAEIEDAGYEVSADDEYHTYTVAPSWHLLLRLTR